MKRFVRFMLSGILLAVLCAGAVAQTTKHKIPTAPEVAMKKKPDFNGRKGIMRGTTNTERWHLAIKHADRRAAQVRAAQKGAK